MQLTYEFRVNASADAVKEYLSDPHNLLKYVPHFKELKELENGWELHVSWLFDVKLHVSRIITMNEVSYVVTKTEGLIKIKSDLRFLIIPQKDFTKVILTFTYDGPFQSLVKRQADSFYKKGVEIFKKDMEGMGKKVVEVRSSSSGEVPVYMLKTLMAKKVAKTELDKVLEDAMIMSVDKPTVVIISDGSNKVTLSFRNGDLFSKEGDINSLNGEMVTVLVKQ